MRMKFVVRFKYTNQPSYGIVKIEFNVEMSWDFYYEQEKEKHPDIKVISKRWELCPHHW